ncbi:PilN domain-containing protein [Amphibacillus sp. Q70]|uniref:PilN domain-containing protein n=1 Tax=Amphibacillus sp. Q70 TaxID=3453416 RepID=UPI003F833D89
MIEINFFEKRKKNYSLLILACTFLMGMVLIGAYLLFMSQHLTNQYQENLRQIDEQQPLVSELEQIQYFSKQVNQLSNELEMLKDQQYPTVFLYETIRDLLPESEALYIHNYDFSLDEGLQLSVQLDDLEGVAKLDRAILNLPFITSVELIEVELIDQVEQHYVINLQADIDREQISEVTSDD